MPFPIVYVLYLVMAAVVYCAIGARFRTGWLVISGAGFGCLFVPEAIPYLAAVIGITFAAAKGMANEAYKKAALICGIAAIAVLFTGFRLAEPWLLSAADGVIPSMTGAGAAERPLAVLQIGAVFTALQASSYLLDVYRGRLGSRVEMYALAAYLLFVPRLLAGPIAPPGAFLSDMASRRRFDRRRAIEGGALIVWGLIQKFVIANRLAVISSAALADPANHYGWELIVGLLAFMLQLYAELCAYTDISRGAARLMGFDTNPHLHLPFDADRPSVYWTRQMIPLQRWVETYLPESIAAKVGMRSPWLHKGWVPFWSTVFLAAGGTSFLAWGAIWLLTASAANGLPSGELRGPAVPFAARWGMWLTAMAAAAALAYPLGSGLFVFIRHLPEHLSNYESMAMNLGLGAADLWFGALAAVLYAATGYGSFGRRGAYPEAVTSLAVSAKPWRRWTLYYAAAALMLLAGRFDAAPFLFGY